MHSDVAKSASFCKGNPFNKNLLALKIFIGSPKNCRAIFERRTCFRICEGVLIYKQLIKAVVKICFRGDDKVVILIKIAANLNISDITLNIIHTVGQSIIGFRIGRITGFAERGILAEIQLSISHKFELGDTVDIYKKILVVNVICIEPFGSFYHIDNVRLCTFRRRKYTYNLTCPTRTDERVCIAFRVSFSSLRNTICMPFCICFSGLCNAICIFLCTLNSDTIFCIGISTDNSILCSCSIALRFSLGSIVASSLFSCQSSFYICKAIDGCTIFNCRNSICIGHYFTVFKLVSIKVRRIQCGPKIVIKVFCNIL